MSNYDYTVVELSGSSEQGISDAINNAILTASKLHGQFDWYEIMQTNEADNDNQFKVRLKIGCHRH
ncbi:MAG: dodecin family protein [Proteobacteria bacterium]|nr:dodecin family protein [Pseudomonadota bacterium]